MITRKIHAESEAKLTLIKARACAEADVLRSDGHKASEITRAEGSLEAAKILEGSKVAVELERIRAAGGVIGEKEIEMINEGSLLDSD